MTNGATLKLSPTIANPERLRYKACPVASEPNNSSNETIKYYLNAPDGDDKDALTAWVQELIAHKLSCSNEYIYIAYQNSENGYHPRSFEDAFINLNIDAVKSNCENINGLKNVDKFDYYTDIYDLVNDVIDKKSDFASSILFMAHVDDKNWSIPSYIWEGLEWIQKQ